MALTPGPVATSTDVEQAMFDFVDAYDRAYGDAAAAHDLSVAQACVLGRITGRRGMRDLADELGCDASNVTQIVARLESRDLLERQPSPDDGRSRQVVRTPTGDKLNANFERSFEFARDAAANLSHDEQNQLAYLLRKALNP